MNDVFRLYEKRSDIRLCDSHHRFCPFGILLSNRRIYVSRQILPIDRWNVNSHGEEYEHNKVFHDQHHKNEWCDWSIECVPLIRPIDGKKSIGNANNDKRNWSRSSDKDLTSKFSMDARDPFSCCHLLTVMLLEQSLFFMNQKYAWKARMTAKTTTRTMYPDFTSPRPILARSGFWYWPTRLAPATSRITPSRNRALVA